MENKISQIVDWIKGYVKIANAKGVVIGMSGGKDSLVCAKLCCQAVGKENVFGVIMPNGEMKDISDAKNTCELLGIEYTVINIGDMFDYVIENTKNAVASKNVELSSISIQNTPPRLRMTVLYSIAGSLNYLVANTSNLSEKMVGYTTKWGDNVGDFYPLANFTKTEVCEIGLKLGLPDYLVNKIPSDGLSGVSDEQKLGYSYAELDDFIRNGQKGENFEKILKHHKTSSHKRTSIIFDSNQKNHFEQL